jgi:dolichol-phosphate mannosyltransferase
VATRVRGCQGGLKLVRRECLRQLDLRSDSVFIGAELMSKARRRGLSVVAIDATVAATESGAEHGSGRSTVAWALLRELLVFWWTMILFPGEDRASAATSPTGVRLWHVWLLTAVASLLFFVRLTFPLVEPDEARYALIGAGMIDSGNLLIPMREGAAYLDKPPLLYWVTVVSYRVLGVHDYAARTVTALAGLGTFLATYWIGRHMVGDRGALLGALMLLLSLGFVLASRFLIMDGLLTFFTTVALLSLYLAARGAALRYGWWLLAAAACGLGVMSKGPVAIVLAVPPVLAWRWLTAAGARIRLPDWLCFALAAGAIAAPWYVAVAIHDPGFVKYFFWDHHVKRFLTDFNHVAPWWFYGFVLFLGMFPASILLPVLGGYLFRRTPALASRRAPAQGFLLLAGLWTLVFFSLSTGKLAPYILPATPPLCLLLGAMLDVAVLSEVSDPFMTLMRRWIPFHGTRIALIAGVTVGIADFVVNRGEPDQWLESGLLIFGSVTLFYYVSRKAFAARPARWFAAAGVPLVILTIGLVDIYPSLATKRSLAVRVARLRESAPETPIVFYGRVEDSLMFYNRDTQVGLFNIEQVEQVRQYLASHPRALLISQAGYVAQLRAQLPSSITLEEQPTSRGKLYVSSSSAVSALGQPEAWARREGDSRR